MQPQKLRQLEPRDVCELGPAWASSSVNCVPFRRHGVFSDGTSRWCAYYDPAGDVVVHRWPDAGKSARETALIPCARAPHDAHNSISLGVDRQKRVHLAFGAHASSMYYARSKDSSCSSESFAASEFEPSDRRRYTYPMFVEAGPERELLLLYRNGTANSGSIEICRWDEANQTFSTDTPSLLDGTRGTKWTAGPYLNDPIVDRNGAVALFFVWRLAAQAIGETDTVVNRGIEFLRSADALRTLSNGSSRLVRPVTPITSVPGLNVPLGSSLINQAGAAFRADGLPMMATYWDSGDGVPQYRLVWCEQGRWHVRRISSFTTRFSLNGSGTLPLPHSRPVILTAPDGSIFCLCRSAEYGNRLIAFTAKFPHYEFDSSPILLCNQDLGYYEPVIDRGAWETRAELLLYVQACQQARGDGETEAWSATATLHSWPLEQLQRAAVRQSSFFRFFSKSRRHSS